jgi:ABC-2 type transport system permease protein
MRRVAARYAAVATAGLQRALQYRAVILLGAVSVATACALQIFLWRAVYAAADSPPAMALTSMTTYVVMAQLLGMLHANKVDDVVSGEVYRGDIAISLLRPVSYAMTCLATTLPATLVLTAVTGTPVLVCAALVTNLAPPTVPDAGLFAVSTVLGMLLAFELNFLVGLAAFLTTNTWGIRMVKNAAVAFLAGQLVPLELLPTGVAQWVRLLPFQGLIDGPLRLLLGLYDGPGEATRILGVTAFWVAVLMLVTSASWRVALRRIEVLGG